jgi:hypothetical protein
LPDLVGRISTGYDPKQHSRAGYKACLHSAPSLAIRSKISGSLGNNQLLGLSRPVASEICAESPVARDQWFYIGPAVLGTPLTKETILIGPFKEIASKWAASDGWPSTRVSDLVQCFYPISEIVQVKKILADAKSPESTRLDRLIKFVAQHYSMPEERRGQLLRLLRQDSKAPAVEAETRQETRHPVRRDEPAAG